MKDRLGSRNLYSRLCPVLARERMPVLNNPKNLLSSVLDMHIYHKDLIMAAEKCTKKKEKSTRIVSTGSATS